MSLLMEIVVVALYLVAGLMTPADPSRRRIRNGKGVSSSDDGVGGEVEEGKGKGMGVGCEGTVSR